MGEGRGRGKGEGGEGEGEGERRKQSPKAILELSNQRNKQDSSNATEASSTEIVGKLGTPQDPQGVDR